MKNIPFRPSQKYKDAQSRLEDAEEKNKEARQEIERITKELEAAKSRLEEALKEYKEELEAFRLVDLEEPSQWVSFRILTTYFAAIIMKIFLIRYFCRVKCTRNFSNTRPNMGTVLFLIVPKMTKN
jgi:exonuclease VII small subunit